VPTLNSQSEIKSTTPSSNTTWGKDSVYQDYLEHLERLDGEEEYVQLVCKLLGITTARKFLCVLHAERRPSAALWRNPKGIYSYKDFHGRGQSSYTLTEVFASTTTGIEMAMAGPTLAVWKLRLMAEVGVLTPVPVSLPALPPSASKDAHLVRRAIQDIYGLRWAREHGTPAPFTRRFMTPWTRLPEGRWESGFGEVLKANVVRKVGECPSGFPVATSLYLPGYEED